MSQRKLLIYVTEVDGDVLAEDGPAIRWELFPYDFESVERSLDLILPSAEKFVDITYLERLEEDAELGLPAELLGRLQ